MPRPYAFIAAVAGAFLLLLLAAVFSGRLAPAPTPPAHHWPADGSGPTWSRLQADEAALMTMLQRDLLPPDVAASMVEKAGNIRGKIASSQFDAASAAAAASAAGGSASTVLAAGRGDYSKPNARLDELEQTLAAHGA